MIDKVISISFRCYYGNGNKTTHKQNLKISKIPRWIDSYKFTHPDCQAITCKVWFHEEEEVNEND